MGRNIVTSEQCFHLLISQDGCSSGVPQGSVLGPLLFITYISPISSIASNFGVSLQQYADDTQLYLCTSSRDLTSNLNTLELCLTSLPHR